MPPASERVAEAGARLQAGAALSKSDVALLIGFSTKWIDRHIRDGTFPVADLRLGDTPRWSAAVIRERLAGARA